VGCRSPILYTNRQEYPVVDKKPLGKGDVRSPALNGLTTICTCFLTVLCFLQKAVRRATQRYLWSAERMAGQQTVTNRTFAKRTHVGR
jgi:hypothetical protein